MLHHLHLANMEGDNKLANDKPYQFDGSLDGIGKVNLGLAPASNGTAATH